jgi:pilus assembly protein FimV
VTEPPKVVDPPKAATPKPPAKAPAKEPPGFFEEIINNTPSWAFIRRHRGADRRAGGAVRRAPRKTTKFEDSIISGTDIKTNTVFGSTGGGVVNTGDNSLASDFSREGLGNIDTDEVDPIAEAEVYLAYGRDAQAEEI